MSIIRNGILSADLDVPVVLPTLNLDFANSQSLDKRITFSRGSIGTRVNRNGLIETIPANQPRFDFDPISGECRGLLIEEQRTNLVTNSTGPTFTGLSGINTTTDGTQAPDGSNAIVYIPTTGTPYHASNANFCTIDLDAVGIATGSTYDVTYSMWIKDYNNSDLGVYFVTQADISNTSPSYALRLAKPKSASWTGGGSLGTGWTRNYEKVVPYPNGWYRFIQSYRYTRQTSYNRLAFYIQVFNNRNAQFYNGDGTSGIHMWGPQVERGAFETSYIPTSGSQVTRSADNASMTGTNFSSWYNQTESTIFCKFNAYNNIGAGQKIIIDIRGSAALGLNLVQLQLNYISATSQQIYHNLYQNGPNFADYFGFSYTTGPTKNIMRYKDLDTFVASKDGNIRSNTSRNKTIPLTKNMNSLTFGTFNGAISKFAYYPKALNDAEMLYLTQ